MKKEERKLEVECCTIARKYGGGCGITENNKSSSDMEKQIENILIKVDEGTMPVQQALSELLLLFNVSCQCEACKQDKIDSNYRKYIELNKNVIGYD